MKQESKQREKSMHLYSKICCLFYFFFSILLKQNCKQALLWIVQRTYNVEFMIYK